MIVNAFDDQDILEHHGVKGMKWGIRRTSQQLGHKPKKRRTRDEVERERRKKDLKRRRTMSSKEIEDRLKRLKLEKEYKDLVDSDINPGRTYVKGILKESGKKALTAAAAGTMAYGVKVAMTKQFNIREAASYIAANPNKKK